MFWHTGSHFCLWWEKESSTTFVSKFVSQKQITDTPKKHWSFQFSSVLLVYWTIRSDWFASDTFDVVPLIFCCTFFSHYSPLQQLMNYFTNILFLKYQFLEDWFGRERRHILKKNKLLTLPNSIKDLKTLQCIAFIQRNEMETGLFLTCPRRFTWLLTNIFQTFTPIIMMIFKSRPVPFWCASTPPLVGHGYKLN